MNRRQFTASLAALGLVPAMPSIATPALGSAAPKAAAAKLVPWAKMLARTHDKCSLPMLQRHLKIDAGLAEQVRHVLLEERIITAPGVNGISRATDPIRIENMFRPPAAAQPASTAQDGSGLRARAQEPEPDQSGTDDGVPTGHADPEEVPGDLVTPDDGGSEDLVEQIRGRETGDIA